MKSANPQFLVINGGSSSVKFAVYEMHEQLELCLKGKIDRIGHSGTNLTFQESCADQLGHYQLTESDQTSISTFLIDWLAARNLLATVQAIGHRIVNGQMQTGPELLSEKLLNELYRLSPFDPEHLPSEIEYMEAFRKRNPKLPQIACFDTTFHREMPRVAKMLPIPRRFEALKIQRYGFHGLSYAFLVEELARLGDPAAVKGRVILAHLGSGSSMAAVRDGKSIDTSMGFTPTGGMPMATRSGDLDPGLVSYLAQAEQMTATQFQRMVTHESGLLGVSEISSDVRDLLAMEASDVRAAEAIALFCYQAKKWLGSFAAALGGLETLVFAGGIGENSPLVRTRICDGLGFLGIEIDESRNAENAAIISTGASRVTVRVIRTDEELMIARSVFRIMKNNETTLEE